MAQTWSDLGLPTSGQVHRGRNGSEEAIPLGPEAGRGQKGPKAAKIHKLAPDLITFRGDLRFRVSTLKEGSDCGLLKKCQHEFVQFFIAKQTR